MLAVIQHALKHSGSIELSFEAVMKGQLCQDVYFCMKKTSYRASCRQDSIAGLEER